jgi:hypothetical protein
VKKQMVNIAKKKKKREEQCTRQDYDSKICQALKKEVILFRS